ncbi:hypothetical protein SAMD00019534_012320 [Acytostelium subglobosum LB1]|uniref:hypothetical protein n=1 Tax=Acytostelium subglobosum LB1 TaxID=1410327 RepID=UPI0006449FD4|nr:hypothetical protein SAMD00019534_012320 [Acytostelium subglobosum LB1]GAM18057.1 hypothetical protein SAMD00019534_012320 [Acytostelium subglobosum LB1]|eukprot:XP_012758653.1 hypothetical protein SAMD00019534_012320 [Acytostelium subglobosum LB1]
MEEQCRIDNEKTFQKALSRAEPIGKLAKYLLAHERHLLDTGALLNITHRGSTSIWLEAPSTIPPVDMTNVYRPMGDIEVLYLVTNHHLPDTQPYQAIIEGEIGRAYANKYLTGKKWTDTNPSTVVEFTCPKSLVEKLKTIQMKVEDGALSMGLGNKAGGGLIHFNESMINGQTTYRIVKIKRGPPE